MQERNMKYVVRVRIVNSINHLQCQDQVQHLVRDEQKRNRKRNVIIVNPLQFVLQYFTITLSLSLLINTQSWCCYRKSNDPQTNRECNVTLTKSSLGLL